MAVGTAIGRVIGGEHSYWVGLTAAAALQANNVTLVWQRTLHRVAGTVTGVALAGGLLAISRAAWFVAVIGGVAQAVAETVIASSYALGVTFITAVAFAIFELAAPGQAAHTVIPARLLDTAIGAGVVLVLRIILWPRASARRLPLAEAAALRSAAALFAARWLDPPSHLGPARHRLQDDLLRLRALAADAAADRWPGFAADATRYGADALTQSVESLGTLALSIPYDRPAPEAALARDYVRCWESLAASLGADRAEQRPASPERDLDGYPRTSAATRVLVQAVAADAGSLAGRPRR